MGLGRSEYAAFVFTNTHDLWQVFLLITLAIPLHAIGASLLDMWRGGRVEEGSEVNLEEDGKQDIKEATKESIVEGVPYSPV